MTLVSVLSPLNAGSSTCGYCGPPGKRTVAKTNVHAAECISTQLSCQAYQAMIDRGWRRSGTYLYKPDLLRTCCPQYTIRLDCSQFKASKSQRKLVNRFNRFAVESDDAEDDTTEDAQEKLKGGSSKRPKGGKASQNAPAFVLEEAIHAAESSRLKDANAAHTFEVMLEPSSFTKEKFDLYQSYQREIHHEEEEKEPGSFQRFLIDSSLQNEDIPYSQSPPSGLPKQYGSYHQLYRLDGKLIAMGVIDILPACVSSVYFMYEKEWERLSMGKMSALREISLVNEIRAAGVPGMEYLYMGFYIHSCQKMRYKGEYAPSYLADPEDYTWHSLDRTCRPLLDKNRYGAFTHPEHSMAEAYTGPPHNPEIPASELEDVKVYIANARRVRFISVNSFLRQETEYDEDNAPLNRAVMTLVDALGFTLAKAENLVLWFRYVIS